MIDVITRLFNTSAFIYMLRNKFVSLSTTTKSVNCNNSFWYLFQEVKPLHLPAFKKRYQRILTLQPSAWRRQLCFRDSKITLFHQNIVLPPKNFLVQHWWYLCRCNMLLFFYLGSSLEWVQVLKRDSFAHVLVQNYYGSRGLF